MLEIRDYRKTFHPGTPNEVRALRGVSLHIHDGTFAVVIGTNGSGKSTLLNAVAGAFLPDEGSVALAGRNISAWPEHRRARLIGRVFQNPFSGTAPGMTIAENLAMAARRGRFPGMGWALCRSLLDECRDRVRVLGMGLEDRLHTNIGGLSGGQRQALTLLMATWQRPSLLLLDEHTAALDPRSAERIITLTSEIVAASRLTTLMVTHSMHQAANLGDRLLMMHRGEVVRDLEGEAKKRLRPDDLLAHFDQVRRREMLDESAAEMLRQRYI
ncbi:MAG TPA: ATP-binding cassette domain-containing protein [Geobacteraceae bacterium]|nr:ATP-binding cassette domain-containing protein [Geobacteraceae bacterium]